MKVSIVIPAYNSEKFIGRCLSSIAHQTYQNIEIVVVNDGSNDSTSEIVKKMQKSDPRIVYISQANSGVSSARNTGINASTGEFITFIDSDDTIEPDTIEKTMDYFQKYDGLDVVNYGCRTINLSGKMIDRPYQYHTINSVLDKSSSYIELLKELEHGGGSMCTRILRSNIIGSIRLRQDMRLSEDQEWLLRIYDNVNQSIYIDHTFYNIHLRDGSATTISRQGDIENLKVVDKLIVDQISARRIHTNQSVKNMLFVRSRLLYSTALRLNCDIASRRLYRKRMIHLYRQAKGITLSEKVKYFVALLPPGMYRYTRRILKVLRGES